MHMIRTAIAGILALFVATTAIAQTFPTVPAQTVIGRLGVGTGPSQAIPVATLLSKLGLYNQSNLNVSLGLSTYNPNDKQAANQYNLAIGPGALGGSPGTNQNVAIGWQSMGSLTGTSGGQNTAYGSQTMPFATSTQFATAMGSSTLRNISTGGYGSVAIGHGAAAGDDIWFFPPAPYNFATWAATGTGNTNVGSWSGQEQTTASLQSCFGMNSCLQNATGTSNVAVGFGALQGDTEGTNDFLHANAVSYSVAIGYQAALSTTGGYQTVYANGYIAFTANPTASSAITLGTTTVTFVASGASGNQVNIGASVGATLANLSTMLNASSDSQISQARYWLGNGNTQLAVQYKTAGSGGNTFALATTVSGATVSGNGSGQLFPAVAAAYPVTAIGYSALRLNRNGQENTAGGFTALASSVADIGNTAFGNGTLNTLNGGNGNTAVGDLALAFTTTGGYNTAHGYRSLYANTTGGENTAVGKQALTANTTAGGVTAIGSQALMANTTGGANTAVGYQSLQSNTTGQSNTAVGQAAGSGAVALSDNTSIGYQAHIANDGFSNVTALGSGATPTASNQVVLGNSTVTTSLLYGAITGTAQWQAAAIARTYGGTGTTTGAFVKTVDRVITASGTYTPSAGLLYANIECIGSGGGGGGVAGTASTQASGGGGGSGSYSRINVSAATIGSSQTVTIAAAGTGGAAGNNAGNAGGDVSVGTLCVGKGGSGGAGGANNSPGLSGAGGVAGTGSFTPTGNPGEHGTVGSGVTIGSTGGNNIYGGGGRGTLAANTVTAGGNAAAYGAGGGGAAFHNTASTAAGGNGSNGVVLITEYLNQ